MIAQFLRSATCASPFEYLCFTTNHPRPVTTLHTQKVTQIYLKWDLDIIPRLKVPVITFTSRLPTIYRLPLHSYLIIDTPYRTSDLSRGALLNFRFRKGCSMTRAPGARERGHYSRFLVPAAASRNSTRWNSHRGRREPRLLEERRRDSRSSERVNSQGMRLRRGSVRFDGDSWGKQGVRDTVYRPRK